MYAVLVQNSDNTWDVLNVLRTNELSSTTIVDEAFTTGLPITGLEATSHKSSAVKGATWDGTSFSGGNITANMPSDEDELWNNIKRYVFLCDNKVVLTMTISSSLSTAEMFDAAFSSGGVRLAKVPEGQLVRPGTTVNWDGELFS